MQSVQTEIVQKGYSFIRHPNFEFVTHYENEFEVFRQSYHEMSRDKHLNAGEGDRFRRYARMAIHRKTLQLFVYPHDTFFQSKTYDVLYGNIHREFPAVTPAILQNAFFQTLLRENFKSFPVPPGADDLYEISVHMIRIVANKDHRFGRPAPEGVHQDGYHFVGIHLMDRQNLEGAQNRIHDLNKRIIERQTFFNPMDSCLFDDRKIFHSVQPFRTADPTQDAYRDMLILLYQPITESPQRPAIPVALQDLPN